MYRDILQSTAHRKSLLPEGSWIMTQKWNDLLFIHLPVPSNIISELLPKGLELDTFDGKAWITIIPFRVTSMRIRNLPPLPFINSYLELNVRTYVKRRGKTGVYFFSLDANNLLAVIGARILSLPYYFAQMRMKKKRKIEFKSRRKGKTSACLDVSYRTSDEAFYTDESSLDYWLLERYHLWSYRNDSLYQGDIHHKQWKVSNVEVYISQQQILSYFPDDTIIGNPLFHYASTKRVLFWPIKKVE
ncbi:DUF2071 domain-containing protein [Oceanobacillus luteolus]|uniref:YqjF family protein n=1 Tax=Oceanobacillus luteolus TaxID=1274358 RepID=A0ABW4HTJ5_9BACI|nr:DUF2071 domain-containing protein [Oceanobacillus luteolus]MCM3739329.1 DUF2071 domain-containing protein [Oceanobacillus luteolus]